jgi:glutathione S-transferase
VPVLVLSTETLLDSASILLHCDRVAASGLRLYADDPDARREVLAIEQTCDAELGVATRVLVYFHALPRPSRLVAVLRPGLTRVQALLLPTMFRFVASTLRRKYRLNAGSAERSVQTVRRIFGEMDARLSGMKYLSGPRFGAADLTFASLAAPVLLPVGHPAMMSSADDLPEELRALALELRATRAGAHAMRMYADHRRGAGVRP